VLDTHLMLAWGQANKIFAHKPPQEVSHDGKERCKERELKERDLALRSYSTLAAEAAAAPAAPAAPAACAADSDAGGMWGSHGGAGAGARGSDGGGGGGDGGGGGGHRREQRRSADTCGAEKATSKADAASTDAVAAVAAKAPLVTFIGSTQTICVTERDALPTAHTTKSKADAKILCTPVSSERGPLAAVWVEWSTGAHVLDSSLLDSSPSNRHGATAATPACWRMLAYAGEC
jgi:hypothetical protein